MTYQVAGKSSIKKAYSNTFQSLKKHSILLKPFIIFGLIDLAALLLIYFGVRMPLRLVFGPIIRTFWGEAYLHYPDNFMLLPKLVSLSRMALTIIFGSFLTGVAVAIVFGIYNKKEIKLKDAFKAALKQYSSLLIVVLIFTLGFYFLIKLVGIGLVKYFLAGHRRLLFLNAGLWLGPILLALNFMLALLIQSAFVYAIPLLIIEKQKLTNAILGSFLLFKRLFFPTLILVGLPMLAYIPIILLNANPGFLIERAFPEFVLWVSFFGCVISALVIDPLVTITTAFLYLINRDSS